MYSRDGKVIRSGTGAASTTAQSRFTKLKSKYEEDLFINGHTTVFGSYFHKGAFRWGYADDHSLTRNSYCTGLNGRIANDEANEWTYGTGVAGSAALAQARELLKHAPSLFDEVQDSSDSKLYIEPDSNMNIDPAKIRAALREQRSEEEVQENGSSERKRGFSSLSH